MGLNRTALYVLVGSAVGAIIGSGIGIAGFGTAISGTIPFLVIGGLIGNSMARRAGQAMKDGRQEGLTGAAALASDAVRKTAEGVRREIDEAFERYESHRDTSFRAEVAQLRDATQLALGMHDEILLKVGTVPDDQLREALDTIGDEFLLKVGKANSERHIQEFLQTAAKSAQTPAESMAVDILVLFEHCHRLLAVSAKIPSNAGEKFRAQLIAQLQVLVTLLGRVNFPPYPFEKRWAWLEWSSKG